jgi:hypothetical protein
MRIGVVGGGRLIEAIHKIINQILCMPMCNNFIQP